MELLKEMNGTKYTIDEIIGKKIRVRTKTFKDLLLFYTKIKQIYGDRIVLRKDLTLVKLYKSHREKTCVGLIIKEYGIGIGFAPEPWLKDYGYEIIDIEDIYYGRYFKNNK